MSVLLVLVGLDLFNCNLGRAAGCNFFESLQREEIGGPFAILVSCRLLSFEGRWSSFSWIFRAVTDVLLLSAFHLDVSEGALEVSNDFVAAGTSIGVIFKVVRILALLLFLISHDPNSFRIVVFVELSHF